ncbi:hypothetical protein TNIN_374021 [Trichonephila inaurata madagascariensis]|uniref:Uncharacterized protein n=1 Tax=Trichonephila inaurata madagascariensis TaxID=2747483 RepID=A0A8X6X2Y3_9ARAC|nr:hypothetical protein TNIN_374021 [Trichonephila inaurata madagascariensis]
MYMGTKFMVRALTEGLRKEFKAEAVGYGWQVSVQALSKQNSSTDVSRMTWTLLSPSMSPSNVWSQRTSCRQSSTFLELPRE